MSDATCQCRKCLRDRDERIDGMPVEMTRLITCPTCGNKRCPHASAHTYVCTGSNATGQPGSLY